MTVLLTGPSGARAARTDVRRLWLESRVHDHRAQSTVLVLAEPVGNAARYGTLPIS